MYLVSHKYEYVNLTHERALQRCVYVNLTHEHALQHYEYDYLNYVRVQEPLIEQKLK